MTDTYRQRLRQYKRRESLTIWVGAGLAGFIALLAGLGNTLSGVPSWLSALLVTSIVAGGAALGFARVQFEWSATNIQRGVADRNFGLSDTIGEEWPSSAEGWWTASLRFLAIAGILMIISVWWKPIKQAASYLGGAVLNDRDISFMIPGVFAAPDLHRLMFGLFYPAVLGTLFFSLLSKLSRILTQARPWVAAGSATLPKRVAGCLIVLHFVVDFQLTGSIPARNYTIPGFLVDLLILFTLFLAFDALNIGRPDPLHVRLSAFVVAGTYVLFFLWSLVTFEVVRGHLYLWGAEAVGFILFIFVAIRRNVILFCLGLAIMSLVMACVGSAIVSPLREVAAGVP